MKKHRMISLIVIGLVLVMIPSSKVVFATNRKLIMVGDSRTFNMSNWVKTSARTKFVAKSGQGYKWFNKEGIPQVDHVMKKGDCIVIWLGVNDYRLPSLKKNPYLLYASKINSLARTKWRKCKVYVASVGYVDAKRIGTYFHKYNRSNTEQIGDKPPIKGIYDFNKKLKRSLDKRITWIDLRKVIGIKAKDKTTKDDIWVTRKNGSKDGLHYSPKKTQEIYDYIVSKISL